MLAWYGALVARYAIDFIGGTPQANDPLRDCWSPSQSQNKSILKTNE